MTFHKRAAATVVMAWLVVSIMGVVGGGAHAQASIAVDREAMEALYHATDGSNWSDRTNWLSAAPLGEWLGIATDESGRITSLYLSDNHLSGPIPPALGQLTSLQYLSLGGNHLSGLIPPALGQLTSLQDLSLGSNELSGPIPPALGQLTSLHRLDLGGNELSGPIPAELGQLTSLQDLSLWSNELSGPIPPALGQLTSLQRLDLGSNELSGPIPPALGQLTSLQYLSLGGNHLSGPIPAELGQLVGLEYLSLWSNELSGPPPPALGQLTSLQRLDLGGNELSGPIPLALGQLVGLEYLSLWSNELSGPIPPALGQLTSLQRLDLGGNELSGPIPLALGQLVGLESLSLWSSGLSGPIPPALGQLTSLQWLDLGGNELSGPIPAELGQLVGLESLSLWSSGLSGPIPPALGQLTSLHRLDLGGNELSGPIPAELGQLVGLEYLSLRSNGLSGPIPPALGQLTSLHRLDLGGNELSGPIPAELGQLVDLEYLSLGSNELSGPPPPALGQLTSLQRLDLGGNELSGPIPPALGQLARLQSLDLRLNLDLTGAIPQSLTQLSKLGRLDIWGTSVCVPSDGILQAWLHRISDFRTSELGCEGLLQVSFSASSYEVREGGTVALTVRLIDQSEVPDRSATIDLTILPIGRATGSDYAGVPERVTITAPSTEATFVITAVEDNHFDDGETVVLGFGQPLPSGVTVGSPNAVTVAIQDPGTSAVTDRDVLEVLYHATQGPNWSDSTNWLSAVPLGEWFGIVTDGNGRVTRLDLGDNRLRGTIPPSLVQLTSLQHLSLDRNELSGTIPPELGQLTSLERLDLALNGLSGPIPPELGQLTLLENLYLGGNGLSGPIPPELGQLTLLENLYLRFNSLSGPIPPELGQLTLLENLYLGSNGLSGPIPPELGQLTLLENLYLGGNGLSGSMPPELGHLVRLQSLNLGFNQDLTGTAPSGLQQLPLSRLDLMATSVCIPEDVEFQQWLATVEFRPSGCGGRVAAITEIDIAVFYTPAAAAIAGGIAEIEATIDLMISETNQAYLDSGVSQRLALVASEAVQYTESESQGRDLQRLSRASDGYMDEVHAIRDRLGADLVHLIADTDSGIANRPGSFGVSSPRYDSRLFAHELGHNMGLSHDRHISSNALFPYSYGYVNQRPFSGLAPEVARWRTIMAYSTQCREAGFGCASVMRFSNPNKTHERDALGVPGDSRTSTVDGPADAVRTLNATRHSVANFRVRPPGNRSPSKNTLSLARSAVMPVKPAAGAPAAWGGALFRMIAPSTHVIASPGAAAPSDPGTLRRREVTVDLGMLSRVPAAGTAALTLNLFDDIVLTGIIERRTPTYSGGYALSGHLAEIAGATVTLVVNGSVVAGTVRIPGTTYHIRSAGAGRHTIIQIDPSQPAGRCGTLEGVR